MSIMYFNAFPNVKLFLILSYIKVIHFGSKMLSSVERF